MTERPIDVRSDTVTRPDARMRRAMVEAEVGDDVYGDDPTVNRLQAVAAERLGQEAALFLPSGTQSNLVALLTHCGRGDEYVVGGEAHTYKYEGGGAAVLGGIQPQTVPFDEHGGLPVASVAAVVKEDDPHFARTRLVCLENSQHGRVQSLASTRAMRDLTRERGLALHLDGARMANAAVALGCELSDMGSLFDTVSLCLSKGLGAPVGSVLAGPKGFVDEARRWRKVAGGGMRQAGVLAAAGLIALDEGFARLHEDHENAEWLAGALAGIDGIVVRRGWTQTNMVWLDFDDAELVPDTGGNAADRNVAAEGAAARNAAAAGAGSHDTRIGATLAAFARERGVLLSSSPDHARLVTHRDVSRRDLAHVVDLIREHVGSRAARSGDAGRDTDVPPKVADASPSTADAAAAPLS